MNISRCASFATLAALAGVLVGILLAAPLFGWMLDDRATNLIAALLGAGIAVAGAEIFVLRRERGQRKRRAQILLRAFGGCSQAISFATVIIDMKELVFPFQIDLQAKPTSSDLVTPNELVNSSLQLIIQRGSELQEKWSDVLRSSKEFDVDLAEIIVDIENGLRDFKDSFESWDAMPDKRTINTFVDLARKPINRGFKELHKIAETTNAGQPSELPSVVTGLKR